MFNYTQQHTSAFRFRRFARSSWASYSSMHREVTIGHLAARVADSSLAKATTTTVLAMLLSHSTLQAQNDREQETRTLPEVEITLDSQLSSLSGTEPAASLTSADFQQTTIHSIADLVALLPGVDLRTRGANDVQADLAMRGGTFDQMLIMLNGINLSDAQTGHHTLDIPIDISMVERVELLSPSQLMARGIVAFCGAVNIVVNDHYCKRLLADISAGSHGTVHASLLGTTTTGPWALTAAAAFHRSDGYRANTDFSHGNLYLQAARHTVSNYLHIQVGAQSKAFGSAGFYSTTYPDQYEATRTLTASVTDKFRLSSFNVQLSAYGRLHGDRFELFRDGFADSVPTWYTGHNHHLSSIAGLSARLLRPLAIGELVLGADLRREGIWSNVLGTTDSTLPSPYNKSAARTSVQVFGGYAVTRGQYDAQAVGLIQTNSQFGTNYGLAATASCHLDACHIHFSAARTFRLPTFTDLYYSSATQQADPDLGAESSTSVELSATSRRLSIGSTASLGFQLSLYYRAGTDIIGWVRPTEADLWLSMNHSAVNALGVDASATLRTDRLCLQLAYSYCHVDADSRGMIASSAIDHLNHRLQANASVQITPRLTFKAGASLRHREGHYVEDNTAQPYGTTLLIDAGADFSLLPMLTIYAEGHNLLDRTWRDLGGVPQPGITVLCGLRLEL